MASSLYPIFNRPGRTPAGSVILWAFLLGLICLLAACKGNEKANLRIGSGYCLAKHFGFQTGKADNLQYQHFLDILNIDSNQHYMHKIISNHSTTLFATILTGYSLRDGIDKIMNSADTFIYRQTIMEGQGVAYLMSRGGFWRQGMVLPQKQTHDLLIIDRIWEIEHATDPTDTMNILSIIVPC